MLGAGRRDRRITVYPVTTGEDALGTESETRGTGIPALAAVTYGTGSERREAAQAGSQQGATFRVLSTPALRAIDARGEIDFGGASWGIVSIAEVGVQQREIEFTAVKNGA